jgi:Glycosyl transferases group 1
MSAPLVVAVGFVGKLPLAGMMLYNLHYLAGLAELGYEVHYVERQNGPEYYDPRLNAMTEDVAGGLETLAAVLPRVGIGPGRFSLVDEGGECHGAGWEALNDALDRARFVLTIADTTWFDQLERCPRRLFVDGDPLFTQAGMVNGDPDSLALERYDVLYTYCTRMGESGCTVPEAGRDWIPTRPVVATSLWDVGPPSGNGAAPVTTVMNWSAGADVRLGGQVYGHKGRELERLIDLPAHTDRPFLLAAGGPAPRDHLQAEGWQLANPLEVTGSFDAYRDFIAGSYADLGIAKHAYVASGSGWFSDRSTCYLGSGRPVLHQETGFSEWLPTGEGVFAFSSAEDVVEALERIDRDYERHARAARAIAEEHFEARTVIAQMLDEAGLA